VTTGGFINYPMAWSPDGLSLAYSSDRDQALRNVYRVRVDGSGEPVRLAPSAREQRMMSWSSQGVIAWAEAGNIWVLPPDGDAAPFFTSEDRETHATFSPDGQWLAYVSNRTGRGTEVYVRPYPGPNPRERISVDGGTSPAWSPDGRQIYFLDANRRPPVLMVVDVTPGTGADFQVGPPAPVIGWGHWIFGGVRGYDVHPDGSIVTVLEGEETYDSNRITELHVVLNFFEELKARVGNQ
jgi:Tol biopolymer transport system component